MVSDICDLWGCAISINDISIVSWSRGGITTSKSLKCPWRDAKFITTFTSATKHHYDVFQSRGLALARLINLHRGLWPHLESHQYACEAINIV